MRKYELIVIVRPDVDKDSYEGLRDKISSTISKQEGELKSWEIWKEKYRFSYSLKSRSAEKRKFNEGTYIISEILLHPQKLGALKYTLDLEEIILRYLIINKEAK